MSLGPVVARTVWTVASIVLTALLAWSATTWLPGDAASRILGPHATPERLAALRERLGLDRPLPVQIGEWFLGLARGDLGTSAISGGPITDLVAVPFLNSLFLAAIAALVALVVGIGLGSWAGLLRRGRRPAIGALIAASAVPEFIIATALVGTLAVSLRWLPSLSTIRSGEPPWARPEILVIPVMALAAPVAVWIARYTAAAVARSADAPHVRAARRSGLSAPPRVVLRHLLPGALAPMVQLFGWMLALLIGGAVVVEQVVAYPGIGTVLVEAVGNRDVPVVTALVTVLGAVVAIALAVSDLLARLMDHRLAAS